MSFGSLCFDFIAWEIAIFQIRPKVLLEKVVTSFKQTYSVKHTSRPYSSNIYILSVLRTHWVKIHIF